MNHTYSLYVMIILHSSARFWCRFMKDTDNMVNVTYWNEEPTTKKVKNNTLQNCSHRFQQKFTYNTESLRAYERYGIKYECVLSAQHEHSLALFRFCFDKCCNNDAQKYYNLVNRFRSALSFNEQITSIYAWNALIILLWKFN